MAIDSCKKCKRAVYFMVNVTTGKPAPIDVVPTKDGNVIVDFDNETYEVLSGQRLEGIRGSGGELRKSHFATCPQAEYFKRRGESKAKAA
jgi:hypothetical protein